MPTAEEIRWLAAFIDADGHFSHAHKKFHNPRIGGTSSDLDTIQKAVKILGCNYSIPKERCTIYHPLMILLGNEYPKRKKIYRFDIGSNHAAQWMMTLYSLMSIRRKSEIKIRLDAWRKHKRFERNSPFCQKGIHIKSENSSYHFLNKRTGKICNRCKLCKSMNAKKRRANS